MKLSIVPTLVVVNLALGGVLAALWLDPAHYTWQAPAMLAPDPETLKVVAPPVTPVDLARYRETLDRPLFASTRRPPPAVAVTTASDESVDPLADLRLFALLDAGQGMGSAILAIGGETRRVRSGDKVGDWTLQRIEGRNAIFVKDAEIRSLALPRINRPPEVPPAAGISATEAPKDEAMAVPTRRAGAKTAQDRVRERIARNNALRIQNGLPPEPVPE